MKKEAQNYSSKNYHDNSFGIAAVVLGILSIVFASLNGIVIGVISLIFANKQQARNPNVWGKNGKALAIVGIILSVVVIILNVWLLKNSQTITQLLGS